ncbi:hypothetical protein [Roseibium sp. RKSG952]|uniref:hypothetical protein n=1 Tax=Roseibium sp. RKSG952 TaxID=2529384 RepID=UPI0012BB5A15|nr:hypothetical protein [Roseibium sp. RKSG952]MTH97608.1 hypothetical protein [Roseibium sp. RKSG952]
MYFKIARGAASKILREIAASKSESESARGQMLTVEGERSLRTKNSTRKSREQHSRLLKGFERDPNTLLVRNREVGEEFGCRRAFDKAAVAITISTDTVGIGGEDGHKEEVISAAVTGFRTNNNLYAYSTEDLNVYIRKHAIARFAEREYESYEDFDDAVLRAAIPDAVLMANLMRFDYSHVMKNVPVPCGSGILIGYDIRNKDSSEDKYSHVELVKLGRGFRAEAKSNGYRSQAYFNTHLGIADMNYDQLKLRDKIAEFIGKHRETMLNLLIHAKFGMAKDLFGVSADCTYDMMGVTEELDRLKATPEWMALGAITRKGALQSAGIKARREMETLYGGQTRKFAFHEPLVNRRRQDILERIGVAENKGARLETDTRIGRHHIVDPELPLPRS